MPFWSELGKVEISSFWRILDSLGPGQDDSSVTGELDRRVWGPAMSFFLVARTWMNRVDGDVAAKTRGMTVSRHAEFDFDGFNRC